MQTATMEREEKNKCAVPGAGGTVLRGNIGTVEADHTRKTDRVVMIRVRKTMNIRKGENDNATGTGNAKDVD